MNEHIYPIDMRPLDITTIDTVKLYTLPNFYAEGLPLPYRRPLLQLADVSLRQPLPSIAATPQYVPIDAYSMAERRGSLLLLCFTSFLAIVCLLLCFFLAFIH